MAQKTFVLVSMLKSKATCFGDSIPSNPKRCMSLGAVLMNSGDMGVTSFPSFFFVGKLQKAWGGIKKTDHAEVKAPNVA